MALIDGTRAPGKGATDVPIASAIPGLALLAGLITVVPGLDTAGVLRSTTKHGRRQGFATALGVSRR